ncbi:DUF2634 domain-containing protein [Paenibacillus xanthanilyticus]|uniref:DUF2634 domain-containing protein n=1 Tax=Paenibacillus xanthanilyticus TaxID=1783531 RepID=A0ABV8K6U3_9BACL
MALSPLSNRAERALQQQRAIGPSRTYGFDFTAGEFIPRMIDGDEAIRQFVHKAIVTARYRHVIYDGAYGCELDDLLGQDIPPELARSEIKRVVREALIYDERVADVTDFVIERERDQLRIVFRTVIGDQTTSLEVTIRNV